MLNHLKYFNVVNKGGPYIYHLRKEKLKGHLLLMIESAAIMFIEAAK